MHREYSFQLKDYENIKSSTVWQEKYGIDYSLKKMSKVDPPKYLVFFMQKDVDVMTALSGNMPE